MSAGTDIPDGRMPIPVLVERALDRSTTSGPGPTRFHMTPTPSMRCARPGSRSCSPARRGGGASLPPRPTRNCTVRNSCYGRSRWWQLRHGAAPDFGGSRRSTGRPAPRVSPTPRPITEWRSGSDRRGGGRREQAGQMARRLRAVVGTAGLERLGPAGARLVLSDLLFDGDGVPAWHRAAACAEADPSLFFPDQGHTWPTRRGCQADLPLLPGPSRVPRGRDDVGAALAEVRRRRRAVRGRAAPPAPARKQGGGQPRRRRGAGCVMADSTTFGGRHRRPRVGQRPVRSAATSVTGVLRRRASPHVRRCASRTVSRATRKGPPCCHELGTTSAVAGRC